MRLALTQSRKKIDTVVPLEDEDNARTSTSTSEVGSEAGGKPAAQEGWSKRWAKGPSPNANQAISQEAYGASWQMQYVTLLRRALKVRRFEALSIQDLAQAVAVAVLGGAQPNPQPFVVLL